MPRPADLRQLAVSIQKEAGLSEFIMHELVAFHLLST
jgi:hypothetical protein